MSIAFQIVHKTRRRWKQRRTKGDKQWATKHLLHLRTRLGVLHTCQPLRGYQGDFILHSHMKGFPSKRIAPKIYLLVAEWKICSACRRVPPSVRSEISQAWVHAGKQMMLMMKQMMLFKVLSEGVSKYTPCLGGVNNHHVPLRDARKQQQSALRILRHLGVSSRLRVSHGYTS